MGRSVTGKIYICIKMDIQEVEFRGMNWIELALNMDGSRTLVNSVMNLQVPQNVEDFLTS